MEQDKIDRLTSIGNITVSASEIAEVQQQLLSGSSTCVTIGTWIIKKAAGAGSCAAGAAALGGIFTLAEVVFFPEGEPILVPLEVVMEAGWGAVCSSVGVAVMGKDAEKYAKEFCAKI